MITKKESTENLSYKNYAYTPDKTKSSTWKLRIDDANHVKAAVAALSKGFRGNKVDIPSKDLSKVKNKVKNEYKKFFPDNDVPKVLESSVMKFNEYIKENDGGVANATLGNTGGMGNVVAPQPSSIPGDVAGSTPGSGDIPAYDMGNRFDFPYKKRKKSKKKKKNKKKNFLDKLGEDYRNMYVTKFSEWNYYPEKLSSIDNKI